MCYQLDIEFNLLDISSLNNDSDISRSEDSRLVFSIPFTIVPPALISHNKLTPSALQLAHQCLAARYESL